MTRQVANSQLRVTACPQFVRDYRNTSVGLQHLAERKVQELQLRAAADPAGWRRSYDRVEGLKGRAEVLEVDLAGGPRLLAVDHGKELQLWRMGDHDITTRAQSGALPTSKDSIDPPLLFKPAARLRFFPIDEDEGFVVYGPELLREWVYWLDDEQQQLADTIEERVVDAVLNAHGTLDVIVGGPGTGKTTLLIWLLKSLSAVEREGAQLDVRFNAPITVVNQLENGTGWDLRSLRLPPGILDTPPPDVILMDDPASLADITEMRTRFPNCSIVAGFDPLQMSASIGDSKFASWTDETSARVSWINVSYRQKEVVGQFAKRVADVVAQSSPFLDQSKKSRYTAERSEITRRCNDLKFANPTGMIKTVEDPTLEDWEQYWRRMYQLRRANQLWTYWTPLLIVKDPKAAVPEGWLKRLDPISSLRVTTNELPDIKGLEFQHAILLLSKSTYAMLDAGFTGSGQKGYDLIRLFRIPFSRAKDSLVTFVFADRDEQQAV